MTLVMSAPMAIAQHNSMSMSMAADLRGSVRLVAAHHPELLGAGAVVRPCSQGVCRRA